jgi:predicted AlkP superfamily phosphohydrolase/phosphomutase
LCSCKKEDQLQIIKDSLDIEEQKLLLQYIESMEDIDEFEVLGFIDYLKHTAWKNDPHVFVSVAENEDDYTNEDRKIVCLVDQNICEGLKIVYQNKVYDYSIYKSRRKVGS